MKKQIELEKAQIDQLNALQAGLAADIASTRHQLAGINADLTTVKTKITRMSNRIKIVQHTYNDLVLELAMLDVEQARLEGQERDKQIELDARKALLAERIRSAYDTNRTSMLESFLSSGSFSDLLAEMSYYIDVGEQDKALAEQVVQDQADLASMHELVVATQARTDDLRVTTAAQKVALNKSLKGLKDAKAELRRLEKETQRNLAIQRATYAKVAVNKKHAAKALAAAAKAQKLLAGRIADIVRRQSQLGNIPSQYNGTLQWPMSGNVTQHVRVHGVLVGAAAGQLCPLPPGHRHRGAVWHAGPRGRRRGRRLHRLELRRRPRPGLDRDHRPQLGAADLVRAHDRGLPRQHPPGQSGQGRSDHRPRGQHGPLDRAASALGGHAQRGLRQPAAVPLGRARRGGRGAGRAARGGRARGAPSDGHAATRICQNDRHENAMARSGLGFVGLAAGERPSARSTRVVGSSIRGGSAPISADDRP